MSRALLVSGFPCRDDQAAGNATAHAADRLTDVIIGLFMGDECRAIGIEQVVLAPRERNTGR